MNFILDKSSKEYELMGGKGASLAKLGQVIEEIPEWFLVSYKAYDLENKTMLEEAKNQVIDRLKSFNDDDYFAVRSSALNEDSKEASFAGQFDTFLYIKKDEILSKVQEVYESIFSERIETYRKENHIEEIIVPSVIIQKMVHSQKSGVAFGANPITSNVKEIVISAVFGLGTGLVDGNVTSDTYTICNGKIQKEIGKKDFYNDLEEGKIIQKELEQNQKESQILSQEEITKVEKLVRKTSDFFGRFQDIEWAFEDGKLYLLQSRPITTLGKTKNKDEKINVFDNSNIVESYGGITTPLTFSFIRMVYENVYRELCKIFNVKQKKIEMNSRNV